MKKVLLGLVCFLVVVGVANMGHAGFLFFSNGGGGKGGHGGSSGPPSEVFKFDFHQFGVKPNTDGLGSNNSVSNPLEDWLKLPETGSNHFVWNNDDGGPIFNHFDNDSIHHRGNEESGPTGQVNGAVPEPATMMLLGIGLVGLAGFRRRKFMK